jgi:CheY-like chemotaxis protein
MELHGFDVKGVVDGGAALSALKRSYDEDASPFDVCVLDMQVRRACASHTARVMPRCWLSERRAQMPCMTGPEAAAAFRAWERDTRPGAPTLPLIALTANVLEEHAAECKAAG